MSTKKDKHLVEELEKLIESVGINLDRDPEQM